MIHPSTRLQFINDSIGFGVVVTERIPRGTITWVRDPLDQLFSPGQFASMHPLYRACLDRHSYVDSEGQWILCWDLGRYMNHSCDPAVLCLGNQCDVAIRDLEPGDELTCDYAFLNIQESFPCSCGASNCRRGILPEDAPRLSHDADRRLAAVVPEARELAQPLIEVALPEFRPVLERVLRGELPVPSIGDQLVGPAAVRRAVARP